jgi:hypothetical protein
MKMLSKLNLKGVLGLLILFVVLGLESCAKSDDTEIIDDNTDPKEEEEKEEEEEGEKIPVLTLNEADFYEMPTSFTLVKSFVTDYNADDSFATDDSAKLQQAIDEISLAGGGKLILPEGKYSFAEINMKSNVHIVVDDKAVIRPTLRSDQKNFSMFSFGGDGVEIKNVSFSGSSTSKFKIDLTQTDNINVTVFSLRNLEGFLLSDFEIDDILTDFSSITFGLVEYNNDYYWPKNGMIKNATTNNSDYGYGLIQAQAASNIYFKDLSGDGGVTLRFETGLKSMNNLQKGGIRDMFAENISCKNGNAAVMISPHAMHNGKVYVNGITSESCGFAVRIGGGYVASKYDQNIGLTAGSYEEVTLLNIKATYGASKAQLKSKHYKYMPCDLRETVSIIPINDLEEDAKSYWGPSIAGVVDTSNFPMNYIKEDVEATGFYEGFEVVDDSEAIENCN